MGLDVLRKASRLVRFVDRAVPHGTLGRQIAILGGATAAAQALIVLLSPLLTRLYGPREFGVFGMFTAGVLIFNTVDSARYEIAIPLPQEEEKAEQLLVLCCVLVFVTGTLLELAVHFWGTKACALLQVPVLASFLWLLPASMVAAGLVEAFSYFAIRKQAFRAVAQSRLAQSAVQNVVQCTLGITGIGAIGLLLGDTLSRIAAAITMANGAGLGRHLRWFTAAELRQRATEYFQFPRLNAPATLLNIVALQLPFLAVPFFFGMEKAGSYFLAYRVLFLPSTLVGSAVGNVFFSETAAAEKKGAGIEGVTTRISLGLMAMFLPLYVALAFAGNPVFQLVFGPKWGSAGLYARLLTPAAFSAAIASPLSTVLVVKNRLGQSLALTVLDLSARCLAIAMGVHFRSLWLTVLMISAFGTLVPCLALILFLRWAGVKLIPLGKKGAMIAWRNLPLFTVVGVTATFGPPLLVTFLLVGMVAVSCWRSSAFIKDLAIA
jgi:lipopolysaccharide exporter